MPRKILLTATVVVFLALLLLVVAPSGPRLTAAAVADDTQPIRALLVTGGCCHDYDAQREIVSNGVSERSPVDIRWTIVHEGGESRDHKISIFKQDGWGEHYDVVVHNTCFGNLEDAAFIESIVEGHTSTDTAAVFLHCALHSYRNQEETDAYRAFTGVRSMRHEAHRPLAVQNLAADHPVMANFPETWDTPHGELYEIEEVWPSVTPLAEAYGEDTEKDHLVIWTNEYEGTRVFGTTLGHHNETVEHDIYLDTLTRGLLWSVDRLED